MDVSHSEDRIELAGLAASWTGIQLLCTIKEAMGNKRVNGKDSFLLMLQDGSGERELSCWGEGAGLVAPLQAGDSVLFEGLHTSPSKEGRFHLRGHAPEMAYHLVSALPGILGSPHIAPQVPLKEAVGHAVVRVQVLGWPGSAARQPATEACTQCQRAITGVGCEHCQLPSAATHGEAYPVVIQVGKVLIGDSSAMVQATVSPGVIEFLAQASSDGLAAMPALELKKRLDEAVGKEFMMLVGQVKGVGNAPTVFHRVDAIADVNGSGP